MNRKAISKKNSAAKTLVVYVGDQKPIRITKSKTHFAMVVQGVGLRYIADFLFGLDGAFNTTKIGRHTRHSVKWETLMIDFEMDGRIRVEFALVTGYRFRNPNTREPYAKTKTANFRKAIKKLASLATSS